MSSAALDDLRYTARRIFILSDRQRNGANDSSIADNPARQSANIRGVAPTTDNAPYDFRTLFKKAGHKVRYQAEPSESSSAAPGERPSGAGK